RPHPQRPARRQHGHLGWPALLGSGADRAAADHRAWRLGFALPRRRCGDDPRGRHRRAVPPRREARRGHAPDASRNRPPLALPGCRPRVERRAAMIAVIFEVWPADGRKQTYLDLAAKLKPELEQIDGFISIERFQSLTDETKILSLSFWRDEEAVKAWR